MTKYLPSLVRRRLAPGLFLFLAAGGVAVGEVYQSPEAFLAETFDGDVPEASTIWLDNVLRERAADILAHPYGALRVRYWRRGERTAWILEEIGKEKPITTGLVVDGGRIERVKILVFRESRGWEVRYPSFTSQFDGAVLEDGLKLDRHIDGISGATLSVRAVKKLAALALMFHRHVMDEE